MEWLLPPAAQCSIQLDYAHELGVPNLGERQLRLKEIPIGVERVQLRIEAAVIADVCQTLAVPKGDDEFLLFETACARPFMRDQRIGNLTESCRNRFLIRN